MNEYFLTLDDEKDMDETLFCPSKSRQESKFNACERMSSPFEFGFEGKALKESFTSMNLPYSDKLGSQDIYDSEDEEFQKGFFSEITRPKSVGTIPKSRRNLSSNISDPCLLSSVPNESPNYPTPENPASGNQSTINSEMNSLDSGIPDEASIGTNQVCETF